MNLGKLAVFLAATVSNIGLVPIARAQTATPSALPPTPDIQSTIDRNGIDRSSGTVGDYHYEKVAIGNKYASISADYGNSGTFTETAYMVIERVGIYSGGFLVARVASGGSVHLFELGTISAYNRVVGPASHTAWTFGIYGTATNTSGSDTYNDVNDDGAILVCSGPAWRVYMGGTCSLYLGSSGTRTDFKMPSTPFDTALENDYVTNTSNYNAYIWPIKKVMPDGEVWSYNYINYAEYDFYGGSSPSPSTWNSIDSSLGLRVYLVGSPTNTTNPGLFTPPSVGGGGGDLYAINTSREYADPLTSSRSFSSSAMSSSRTLNGVSYDHYNNGIKTLTTTQTSSAYIVTKPNGGTVTYSGVYAPPPYYGIVPHGNLNGSTPTRTPVGAFPFPSVTVIGNHTTTYTFTMDDSNWHPDTPERYTGNVTNPDGSTESFRAQFGLLQSQTDGLARSSGFGWSGAATYFHGIPGYSTIPHLAVASLPNGLSKSYSYLHGAVSSASVIAAGGGAAQTTTVGLPSSCTVANYRICDKPIYIKDPKGNQTDYTYDPAHGGILTETLPADANGVRPQKRYTYTQLYPKVLNSSGVLVNSTPVWRVTRMSECMSATTANPASCVGTAAEKVTTYAYNDNNLFLTSVTVVAGDGTNSATTSYAYDYAGDVTMTDGPRTDVDDRRYVTYDVLRRKVFEIGADPDGGGALPRPVVHHVYDADGNEIRTEVGTGNATDGSDFVVTHFKRMTYDAVTGQVVKAEEVTP